MTTDIEVINGHTYLVTRNDAGTVIAEVCQDTPPASAPPPIRAKAQTLITALKAGTATPLQQQQALALCLGLLMNLSDI